MKDAAFDRLFIGWYRERCAEAAARWLIEDASFEQFVQYAELRGAAVLKPLGLRPLVTCLPSLVTEVEASAKDFAVLSCGGRLH